MNAYGEIACSGEEIAKFVEGDGHHTVGGIEGFLDAIAVVNININVQNTSVDSMDDE